MLMQATIKEVVSFLSPDIEERSRVPDYTGNEYFYQSYF